ncbi:alkaline phosphatase-like protein [Acephala macrosclerotiorum]|nr:alkaline phosphatase-like protein [Acephala macrosclerotiorum]
MEDPNPKLSKKRDILFLISDDLGKYLGCYGGTKFDMAFTSTASYSASRSVIYTGLHAHENGQYGLVGGRHHFTTFGHVETMSAIFNSLGYQTGIVGKVHVGPESVYPWETREESGTRDFSVTAKRTDRPLHSTVGYTNTHRDFARFGFENQNTKDKMIRVPEIKPEDVEVSPFLNDLLEARQELAEYYQSICRLDIGVGLILKTLESQGLADSTLVCFISDNGSLFMNSKTTLYDARICLLVIIQTPHHSQPGTCHVFGSHTFHEVHINWPTRILHTRRYKYHRNLAWRLDFPFATDIYGSLSWEGTRNSPPPVMVGSRLLKNHIRRPAEELYDLDNDPQEVKNLAADKDYEGLVKEMRMRLEKWQLETKDHWLCRDGVSVVINVHHREAGLRIPGRWEGDVERPGNRDVEFWKAPTS